MKLATQYIHAGSEPDASTGAIMTPIYQTSTFVQDAPGVNKGYDYSRAGNPTRTSLETAIAQLEHAKYALAFSSGVAATDAVLKLLKPHDEVIVSSDLYGGTFRLFENVYRKFGITFHYVDMRSALDIVPYINNNTKMIWVETPSNPLLSIVDIEAVDALSRQYALIFCVDNTFASPYLQNPIKLGADIVIHSATKYLAGHSDVILGAVATNDVALHEKLYFIQKACGAVPGPFDCFLTLRGIKTLHVRMQRHCENAEKVAYFLREHPKVKKVYWCGFEDHQNHEIAKKQMHGFGGMISFELKDEQLFSVNKFLKSTKIFVLAESLGGVESLMSHPATMTHASIPREERIAKGITDSLIRLSVGIEDADDLVEDLKNALETI